MRQQLICVLLHDHVITRFVYFFWFRTSWIISWIHFGICSILLTSFGRMPPHKINRSKVCAVCWRKGSHRISPHLAELIRRFVMDNFDIHQTRLPSGICSTCKASLYSFARGNVDRALHIWNNFDAQLSIGLRSTKACACRICKITREKTYNWRTTSSVPSTQIKFCPSCFCPLKKGVKHAISNCKSKKTLIQNIVNNSGTRNTSASRLYLYSPTYRSGEHHHSEISWQTTSAFGA